MAHALMAATLLAALSRGAARQWSFMNPLSAPQHAGTAEKGRNFLAYIRESAAQEKAAAPAVARWVGVQSYKCWGTALEQLDGGCQDLDEEALQRLGLHLCALPLVCNTTVFFFSRPRRKVALLLQRCTLSALWAGQTASWLPAACPPSHAHHPPRLASAPAEWTA